MNLTQLKKALRQKDAGASFTRKTIAVCALSLVYGPLFAQSGFDFGLKGIVQATSLLNSTDIAAGPELDYKDKVTIGEGVSAGYTFTKHMGVEINVLFSKQGQGYIGDASKINSNSSAILSSEFQSIAQFDNIPFSGDYTARIILNTIKIPFLFRYTGNNTKKVFFSSFIGPQIDMISSVKFQVNGQNASFAGAGFSPEDLYKKTTIDGVLGLGAGMNLSKNLVLSVHLRLDYGFGDVEDKSFTPAGSTDKFYDASRAKTNNATGGGLVSLNYRLVKKHKEPAQSKAVMPKAKR